MSCACKGAGRHAITVAGARPEVWPRGVRPDPDPADVHVATWCPVCGVLSVHDPRGAWARRALRFVRVPVCGVLDGSTRVMTPLIAGPLPEPHPAIGPLAGPREDHDLCIQRSQPPGIIGGDSFACASCGGIAPGRPPPETAGAWLCVPCRDIRREAHSRTLAQDREDSEATHTEDLGVAGPEDGIWAVVSSAVVQMAEFKRESNELRGRMDVALETVDARLAAVEDTQDHYTQVVHGVEARMLTGEESATELRLTLAWRMETESQRFSRLDARVGDLESRLEIALQALSDLEGVDT